MYSNMRGFGKAFGYSSLFIEYYPIFLIELPHALATGEWRSFFVKLEAAGLGIGAAALTAWVFSVMLSTPAGIVGYALMLAILSALINEENVEEVNELLGL